MSRSLARRVSCLGFCCVVWTCTGKCTLDFDFWPILKLQAPVEIGLTYDTTKIRITKYETKVDPLTIRPCGSTFRLRITGR